MADTQNSGGGSGPGPDAYPTRMPFGISLPGGTGAPGSGGAGRTPADPTLQPGQDDGGPITGSASKSDAENTGAPGSSGAPAANTGSSVRYTEPGSFLSGSYESESRPAGDDTEAGAHYGGSPNLPGIKGNTPSGTGAGGGRVMRGGRMRGGS